LPLNSQNCSKASRLENIQLVTHSAR